MNFSISQNVDSVNLGNSFGLNRPYYPPNLQQTGFNLYGSPQKNVFNSYAESNLENSIGRTINTGVETSILPSINQPNVPNISTNIPVQGATFGTGVSVSVDGTYSNARSAINPAFGAEHSYRYGIFDKGRGQSIGSSSQFSFTQQNHYSNPRPESYSLIPQPVIPTLNPTFHYPGPAKQNQLIQNTYQQQGQTSHNSLRLPS